ncbi:hypothetical protein ABPG75_002560 [Micractinium tetrahymenae]
MSDGELPPEVEAFLLVGRVLERCKGSGKSKETGVARYHTCTFGEGQQHEGLPVCYGRAGGEEGKDGKGKAQRVPMPTDFEFAVFWEGQEEPEMLGMEEVQRMATDRFVDEAWLPPAIRALIQDGWDGKWCSLSMDTMRAFLDAVNKEDKGSRQKELAAAKRQAAAEQRKTPAARKAPATGRARGKAAAKKEGAPLVSADGVADALAAKKEARKRKAMEAAAAGSPPKRIPSLAGRVARLPAASAGAAAHGTTAAAAAATMEPSTGQASPGGYAQSNQPAAAAHKRRQQVQQEVQQQQQHGASSSSLGHSQQQQQQQPKSGSKAAGTAGKAPSGSKSKQTLLSPAKSRPAAPSKGKGKAAAAAGPSGSKGKAATTAPATAAAVAGPSPAKSGRQRSAGSVQDVPEVLRQHEKDAMAPEDSAFLLEDKGRCEEVACSNGGVAEVFWYDRVQGRDGTIYRVYSQTLVVPEALCYRAKADRRLRSWKVKAPEGGEYAVEAVLAEEEDGDGDLRYLVKWKGYEADPADDGWLYEGGMKDCKELLRDWKRKGRAQWEATRKQLLEDAEVL